MTIIYRYPQVYDLVVKALHGKSLKKRYEIIGNEIGENKKVFELGCGTSMIYPFLHKGCEFEGWDLNERFLKYCRKREIKVSRKDIFDFQDYPENDVTLICDVLHHVIPRHEMLVMEALKRSKKVIVSEPARSFKPPKLLTPIVYFFNYVLGDYDGINDAHSQLEWDYNEVRLRSFFQRLGCTKTINVGWDMVAVFDSHST
jgi:SAM-dependent methyltransferase